MQITEQRIREIVREEIKAALEERALPETAELIRRALDVQDSQKKMHSETTINAMRISELASRIGRLEMAFNLSRD